MGGFIEDNHKHKQWKRELGPAHSPPLLRFLGGKSDDDGGSRSPGGAEGQKKIFVGKK